MLTRLHGRVRGKAHSLVVSFALAALSAALPAQKAGQKKTATAPQTPDTVRELVALAESKRARTGIVVHDQDGKRVFSHRGDEAFAPASNQKLLTAIAALEGLGSTFTFQTKFRLRGGALEVEPGGDPCWHSGGDRDPAKIFANVAAATLRAGATAVREVLVLDGGFVGPDRPATWPQDQLDRLYCPPTGGLVLEEGAFRARVVAAGELATIEVLAPPVVFPIEGTIRVGTPAKGKRSGFSLVEASGKLLARGLVLPGAKAQEVCGLVQDPGRLVGLALEQALGRIGVAIAATATPPDADLLVETSALMDALRPMLKESSNFHAEQVLRVLGKKLCNDGSFAGGVRALHATLKGLVGDVSETSVCVDGSGLSRDTKVTPALLARLLQIAKEKPYGVELRDSLPLGGIDGTLDRRFLDKRLAGKVFAKTGYIRGVSALSGYVLTSDGKSRVFSILMNWDPDGKSVISDAKEIQEKIVECIAARRFE